MTDIKTNESGMRKNVENLSSNKPQSAMFYSMISLSHAVKQLFFLFIECPQSGKA